MRHRISHMAAVIGTALAIVAGAAPVTAVAATIDYPASNEGIAYSSLQEAINAARGGTVRLTADVDLGGDEVTVYWAVTIDMAGHSITGTAASRDDLFYVRGSKLTLAGEGTVSATGGNQVAHIDNSGGGDGELTVGEGVTIKGPAHGVTIFGNSNTKLDVAGTIETGDTSINTHNTYERAVTTITIREGASVTSTGKGGVAIFLEQDGTLDVWGSVTAETAIYAKSGIVTVHEGATVRGTGEKAAYQESSYAVATGDAIVLENDDCWANPTRFHDTAPILNVEGGTVESANGAAVAGYNASSVDADTALNQRWDYDDNENVITGAITGGTFSDDSFAPWCAEGFKAVKNDDGTWSPARKAELKVTVTYSWTDAPDGQALPTDDNEYLTIDDAIEAMSETPAKGETVRGEKGGKVGTFTFSGWTVATSGNDVTATGSWSFKADEWRVSYSWTGDPSGQKLPSNNNVYNTEAEARKAVSPTPAKGAKVSGVKDGKVGTFTFSGWTAKASGNTVKASGSWTFVPTPNKWSRVWGQNHYDTAAAVCRADKVFSSTGGTVVLATGESYWDALSASGLAGLYRAPILITPGSHLGDQARSELKRLRPSRVVVMGGWMAVSDSTLAAVRQAVPGAKVERCYGQAQDDTARAAFQAAPRSSWGDTCVVATSNGYWDALSIAPYAYARHAPIFLTRGGAGAQNVLSPATMSAIRSAGFKRVVIVGGTMAVPASVESSLRSAGLTVTRLWGQDHYDTSAKIAKWELSQGMTTAHMAVSTGRGYWDALSGAALVGAQGSVVAIADDGHLQAIDAVYQPNDGKVQGGYVLGGEMAVSRKTWDYLQ